MFLPLRDDVENHRFPVAGLVLVGANMIVFAHMMWLAFTQDGSGPFRDFVDRWALVPADVAKGDFIGLVSSMFLHGGLIHIAGNLIVLWALIHTLEGALGTLCCLGFFLLWGIAGSLAHVMMHWGETRMVIGASGAIAGVIGAYCVAFGPMTNIRTFLWIGWPLWIDIPAGLFAAAWFFTQLLGLAGDGGTGGGVAWYAHLGGFAAGSLTMLLIRDRMENRLVRDRHGALRFEEASEPVEEAAEVSDEPLTAYAPPPDSCPHCGEVVGEPQRIADNLLRCGNPDCERMIYLELIDPQREVAGSR